MNKKKTNPQSAGLLDALPNFGAFTSVAMTLCFQVCAVERGSLACLFFSINVVCPLIIIAWNWLVFSSI